MSNLSSQIDALQLQINSANTADIKLRSLEQDADAARLVLDDFTKRYNKEIGIPLTPPDSRVVSRATVPVDAVSPRYGLVLLGGTLGSAGFALAVSLLVVRVRGGFYSTRELGDELGLVVAGVIPVHSRRRLRDHRQDGEGTSPVRELTMTIRSLAHISATNSQTRIVLVTSALAGEGKSNVALSLARSLADAGQRCLLIDADLRNPSLHSRLGVPATPGLADFALDGEAILSMIRPIAAERFDFLPVGRPTQDTLSLFTVDGFGITLNELKRSYDVIVLDSAPLLLASEGLVLSCYADLTLFLVQWRSTPRELARKAAMLLTQCSRGLCLAVLAQVSAKHLRQSHPRTQDYYSAAFRQRWIDGTGSEDGQIQQPGDHRGRNLGDRL